MIDQSTKEINFAELFIDRIDKVQILMKNKDGEEILSKEFNDFLVDKNREAVICQKKEQLKN